MHIHNTHMKKKVLDRSVRRNSAQDKYQNIFYSDRRTIVHIIVTKIKKKIMNKIMFGTAIFIRFHKVTYLILYRITIILASDVMNISIIIFFYSLIYVGISLSPRPQDKKQLIRKVNI